MYGKISLVGCEESPLAFGVPPLLSPRQAGCKKGNREAKGGPYPAHKRNDAPDLSSRVPLAAGRGDPLQSDGIASPATAGD